MKSRNTNGADNAPLPIHSHALKRQAKRTHDALQEFLKAPPEQLSLMYAQNFLAKIWGRSAWDLLKPADEPAAAAPDVSRHLPAPELPYLQRMSPARGGAVLGLFINGAEEWVIRQRQLAEIIVDLEWERLRLTGEGTAADAGPQALRDAPPFSLQAMRAWLTIENLEEMAWNVPCLRGRGDTTPECYERLSSYLVNLPGYDRVKHGKRGGQGEDTRIHHGYLTAAVTVAIDKVFKVISLDPVLWDIEWTSCLGAAADRWSAFSESWLRHELQSEDPTMTATAIRYGGQLRGTHALEMLSLGTRSRVNQDLYSWLSKPNITAEIAADLARFMCNEIKHEPQSEKEKHPRPGCSELQCRWDRLLDKIGLRQSSAALHALSTTPERLLPQLLSHVTRIGEARGLAYDDMVKQRIEELSRRRF